MLCFQGRLPVLRYSARIAQRRTYAGCLIAVALSIVISSPAYAALPPPLDLSEAELLALAAEPGKTAIVARIAAMNELSVAAGQLPDPKLRVGLANYPIESGGFRTEGMTHVHVGVRQAFPPGDTRILRTRRLLAMASELEYQAAGRDREVLHAIRDVWLETHYRTSAVSVLTEARSVFRDLVSTTESLYAVGNNKQPDVLRVALELSRLDDRLIEANKQLALARALLSAWVGTEAQRPLTPDVPRWRALPDLETLRADLLNHPVLTAAQARMRTKKVEVDLARESGKPGWALDLGYAYRDGVLANGRSRSDFVSLSVTVDLPLFRANRQQRSVAAARSERQAADDTYTLLHRQLSAELGAEYARWQEMTRRLQLYETSILRQLPELSRATLLAYQSGTGDFAEVVRSHTDELNTRLDYHHLQVQRAQCFARLASLTGITP